MATKPKRREYELTADARRVADAARRHLSVFEAADAGRRKKLLPVERLVAFEGAIAELARAMGLQITTRSVTMKATAELAAQRRELREKVRDIRDEVRLGHRGDRGVGRAFGVGMRLGEKSTPEVLTVAQGVLSSWEEAGFRAAAMAVGITEARIEDVRVLARALAETGTKRSLLRGKGRGRTRLKRELLEKVRAETVYVREVAQVVLRKRPELLVEFASTLPRRAVRSRKAAEMVATPRADAGGAALVAGEAPVRPVTRPVGRAKTLYLLVEAPSSTGERRPSGMEMVPLLGDGMPSRMEGSPSIGEMSPSRMETSPSRAETSPSRVETSSSRAETSPSRVEMSPSRVETSPPRAQGASSGGKGPLGREGEAVIRASGEGRAEKGAKRRGGRRNARSTRSRAASRGAETGARRWMGVGGGHGDGVDQKLAQPAVAGVAIHAGVPEETQGIRLER
jgi:hypothetical protein